MKRFNESGQVGPVIVLLLAVISIPLGIFIIDPIISNVQTSQTYMLANGAHISQSRVDVLNNMHSIWTYLCVILLIIAAAWFWEQSLKDRDTVV